ncbi:TPA: hypothetical protein RD852_000762 [Listeria monocytogenes]|uniref:Uncharacterized protein n=1 Tax=Listeria ivanovii TaxID=1638 RepID=A0AAX2DTC2_LISIV|nr:MULTISPECIES: hypothetical protein [Listeria]AIS61372.1 hypothetical protein JL53_00865 [Listeria ivanovii subsp. londoniensis]AIS61904.1 hypothetical protein JL53_03835 [Listeria ivanovii subsp. londoniensis]EAD5710952.1 hypothetical protein [Listeria innocua]EAE2538730.1 hypothetical protein [Listeria monocytogenes]EAE4372844.1 hypothetical protein [Listeria monocytogenes]
MEITYKDTQLKSINTSIEGISGGELERKNSLMFDAVYEDEIQNIIVRNEEKIVLDGEQVLFQITLESHFTCDEKIEDIRTILDVSEERERLTIPVLSESSLIIGFITGKLFGIPMVVAPMETEMETENDE